jgi:hypothetical protein
MSNTSKGQQEISKTKQSEQMISTCSCLPGYKIDVFRWMCLITSFGFYW